MLIKATARGDVGVTVIIPTDRAGVELIDDWDGIGQRVTGTGTTNLHDVRVEPHEVDIDRETPPGLLPYISTIARRLTACSARNGWVTVPASRSIEPAAASIAGYAVA